MIDFRRTERILGRTALAALAVLAAVVIWTVRPWSGDPVALRPDTGAAARDLSEPEMAEVLIALLTRVYAAFGQEEEGAIYDGLVAAVAPGLVTDLYLQRRAAQVNEPPEMAGSAEILDVTLDEMTLLGRTADGYRLDATWTVIGILGHEDHRHERVNRYSATMTLGPAAGEWRLTAFDLNQVRRQDVPLFLDMLQ
ncbi:hypothetical protein HMH01_02000 [Halovulum dunhuangense]|uniref:SnoaL-like protein n=1 Tax=Halovulum dunhuangense TaxID=1505036 RepID=A0A849L052_9RHOB|nr:hypothetical protein [Halovulum dunhuangense]NNU79200.1 hypothetical protein [Halovulum dunhuangense]